MLGGQKCSKASFGLGNQQLPLYMFLCSPPRVVKRPWFADDFLGEVYKRFVMDERSMTKKIQYSDVLKEAYKAYQKDTPDQIVHVQTDLGLAEHRFDSSSKPGAVFVLTMIPMHMFAIHLFQARKGDASGQCAREHLDYCSGTLGAERLLQMGMLADAGDEGLVFTRTFDDENTDTAQMLFHTSRFLSVIKTLFIDGKALETGSALYQSGAILASTPKLPIPSQTPSNIEV